MKYEFHVGDYVETKGGATGYVSDNKELWWRCTTPSDGYKVGDYSIIGIETGNYNHIGKYDFTKPEVKKIEKLTYEESYINGYQVLTGRKLIDKINELVYSVNELREKIN
jgi:hypothetical protein